MSSLKVVMAQINTMVGDIPGNTRQVQSVVERVDKADQVDLLVFPELTLMGYPPEDLVLRPSVEKRVQRALRELQQMPAKVTFVVGYPKIQGDKIFNMAGVFRNGELIAEYAKQILPNYQVFDDKRYFAPGNLTGLIDVKGVKVAVLICEDIWEPGPIEQARDAGARFAVVLNASPFHTDKHEVRCEVLAQQAGLAHMPVVYVNQVGGQDELVFDGGSMVVDVAGRVHARAPFFRQALVSVRLDVQQDGITVDDSDLQIEELDSLPAIVDTIKFDHDSSSRPAAIYQALLLGVRDYVNKNGFSGVVLGLSGGIDSALTLAIAADALGKDRVQAVMMPFRYTSQMSRNDAASEAQALGVRYQSISIEPMYNAFVDALQEEFKGLPPDKTEENIQARCRGILLMSISNKKGLLVLTTGNKSELAVGYATLYGDMAGGFDVLKDVPKTLVFELARYRNSLSPVIPQSVIDRPPSAELAPDQKDEDSLPPYSILDRILEAYIEQDRSADDIVSLGFNRDTVRKVIRMVDINEYKRRQAPIGPRITQRGFGRDRRYPITSGWQMGE